MSSASQKKKVVILGPLPPPFMGPTLATSVILDSELKREFELCHLDTSDHRSTDTLGNIDFWNVVLPVGHYFKLFFVLLTRWPDLVYIPVSQTTLGYLKDSVFILISKLFRRKVLCHLRGGNFKNWLNEAGKVTNWYVRHIHSLVDGQIVLGRCLKPLFDGIVPSEAIHVVHNGKDVEIEVSAAPSNVTRILFLSNLKRTKGTMRVLRTVPNIVAKYPNVEFQFAGDWPESDVKAEFEAFLKEHPQLPVKYLGLLTGEKKKIALAAADIFVLPTNYPAEGHPWVLVEAMANGLPIISTDQGAIVETVVDSKNGYIVDHQNQPMLEEKLGVLVEDESLRVKMGHASRELYEKKFTEHHMVLAMSSAINGTLAAVKSK